MPDFFGEAMKEIQALKTLEEIKAPNINHIIEGRLVGSQMWMVTEYCAGGSVKTLVSLL